MMTSADGASRGCLVLESHLGNIRRQRVRLSISEIASSEDRDYQALYSIEET